MNLIRCLAALSGACLLAGVAGCGVLPESVTPAAGAEAGSAGSSPGKIALPATLNELGTAYAKLVLALGEHDRDYVDAFYGPAAWRDEAKQRGATLKAIELDGRALLAVADRVTAAQTTADPELLTLRRRYLKTQLAALIVRAQMLEGRKLGFDEEARLLYDTEAPHYHEAQFAPILKRIEQWLPMDAGSGTLAERYNRYVERYSVPPAQIEAVMQTAIAEARARALAHLSLPPGERFELSLVNGKSWSAYNWYQGHFVSHIEVNTDLPIPVSRVIDLAAHEGYPGHHVYNGLLESRLVDALGWPEYQVYALFSPQSLIAEGSADFGVGLAFPGDDKLALTRTLFKQAGFDPEQAATYLKIVGAVRELAPAGIEAGRRYLDGQATVDETAAWLQTYLLYSPERARQRLAFFDKYRAYVINYTWGEERVRAYVREQGNAEDGSEGQWQAFFTLLSTPQTPAGIAAASGAPISPASTPTADVNNSADFDHFIATHPTLPQFHTRYPNVVVILPGTIVTREFRSDRSRYFPELDADGHITGGHFE